MVFMDMLFAVGGIMLHRVFSSPAPAAASGLRSAMPVRRATTGRQFRTRATATRGTSTSVRATPARAANTTAAAGGLFALSNGSPNSEQRERIRFFNSLILSIGNIAK